MRPQFLGIAVVVLMILPGGVRSSAHAQDSSTSPLLNQTWVRLGGPIGGLGYDIRMRTDNPDIMYVTDAWSGLHKSTDGGKTWFPSNQGIDWTNGASGDAIPVFCVTIDPNNNDTVWVGLQELGGIFRSTDGGATWERRFNGIVGGREGLSIRGITVQPGNSDVLYAAGEISSWMWAGKPISGRQFDLTKGVVYKSIDAGAHWQAVWRGDNLARYIWIDPTNVSTIFVSTGIFDREAANSDPETGAPGGVGILKSTDSGKTWNPVNEGLKNLYVGSLFMDPKDPQTLLAGTGSEVYREGQGIYITHDGGAHWQFKGGNDVDEITSVEFAGDDSRVAYAAGSGAFYRSEDGGETWSPIKHAESWVWGPVGIRPGFPIDLQVDPRNSMRIFANNYGGGNFLSEDGGQTWISSSTGYTGADLNSVVVNPRNSAIVYANGRSGPFVSHDGGRTWEGINPANSAQIPEGVRIGLDPNDPTHVLISSDAMGLIDQSLDSGQHLLVAAEFEQELQALPYSSTSQKLQGLTAVAFAPSNSKLVYGGFGVYRCVTDVDPVLCATKTLFSLISSKDGGGTWTPQTGTALDGLSLTSIVVDPRNTNSAWASTAGGGVFYTDDCGDHWKASSIGLPVMVMDLALDTTDPNLLYAATAATGVYKSLDGGKSWKAGRGGMDPNEQVGYIVIDPVHTNVIYAASWRSGVFMSEDSGKSWRLINNGLHMRSVHNLAISSDGETLYAGTRGEGAFRLSTHDQAYFDALAPAPTLVPPPSPQVGVSSTSETPANGPTSGLQSWQIFLVPGALVVIAVMIMLVIAFRRRNK